VVVDLPLQLVEAPLAQMVQRRIQNFLRFLGLQVVLKLSLVLVLWRALFLRVSLLSRHPNNSNSALNFM
jgi:hypothetical protein